MTESALVTVLEASRAKGFLGPGPSEDHIEHASGFARAALAAQPRSPTRALDLGSGGGVPGLVLASLWWPATVWVLLEASLRRCEFLADVLPALGLHHRVEVRQGRAEDLGRSPDLRGACDLVVARSFGPPGVVAECAAPFLALGGLAVVSEPPGGRSPRWVPAGLSLLGLRYETARSQLFSFALLRAEIPCPGQFPRRNGVPAKRPLF
ncbi:MAG: RsmG family class I SAM-dependent methyltransferase [Acidimicrobiales bacterium]